MKKEYENPLMTDRPGNKRMTLHAEMNINPTMTDTRNCYAGHSALRQVDHIGDRTCEDNGLSGEGKRNGEVPTLYRHRDF